MDSYPGEIVVALGAMVLVLAVCLIRERLIRQRSAAKPSARTDETIATAEGVLPDLHSRVVTLESRTDAIDLLLVGLLKALMKSQSHLDAGGGAAEDVNNQPTTRHQNFHLEETAIAPGQKEKITAAEAGVSPDEYKIGSLLRRLATL